MGDARTVTVRIAVAVDGLGQWSAEGWNFGAAQDDDYLRDAAAADLDAPAVYFLEAELPIPDAPTIQATVTKAEEGE